MADTMPWEDFEAPAKGSAPWEDFAPSPKTSAGQAALEHFGNSASLGYIPQLQAMAEPITDRIFNKITGQDVTPAPLKQALGGLPAYVGADASDYIKARDANSKRLQVEEQEHPYASAAGSVAGAVAGGAAIGSRLPINAATAAGRVGQAALGAGIIGGFSNPGDTEGEVSGLQLGERAKNAALGAAIGGAGQTAIEGLGAAGRIIKNLPSSLQSKAEERAVKSAGATLKDYRALEKAGNANELGRYMLDNGLVKPGMSPSDIAEAAEKLRDINGEAIGNAYDKAYNALQDAGQNIPGADLNPKQLAEEFLNEYGAAQKGTPGGGARLRSVKSVVNDLSELPENSGLSGVNKFREGLDNFLYANNKSPATLPETKQGLQAFRSWLDQRVDGAVSAIDRATGGNVSQQLPELNRQYGLAKQVASIARDQVLRQNANGFFSPTDYLSGLGGAAIGAMAPSDNLTDRLKHAAVGAGVGLVNKFGRTYGTPLVSQALDSIGANLGKVPVSQIKGALAPVTEPISKAAAQVLPAPAFSAAEGIMSRPNFTQIANRSVASAPDQQPTGPALWMQRGIQKLGIRDQNLTQRLMADPMGKHLLIQASDLAPGSKAMANVRNQIQKGWGK